MIIFRDSVVKVRKEHKCFGCPDIIYIGEQANYLVQKDGGDFLISYWCKWCNIYIKDIDDTSCTEGGINDGEMWEIDEYVDFRKEHTGINSLPEKFRGKND